MKKLLPLLACLVALGCSDVTAPEFPLTFSYSSQCATGGEVTVDVFGVSTKTYPFSEFSTLELSVPAGTYTVTVQSTMGWQSSGVISIPANSEYRIECQ